MTLWNTIDWNIINIGNKYINVYNSNNMKILFNILNNLLQLLNMLII